MKFFNIKKALHFIYSLTFDCMKINIRTVFKLFEFWLLNSCFSCFKFYAE